MNCLMKRRQRGWKGSKVFADEQQFTYFFFYRFQNGELAHTQLDAGMLMSLAFLKLLLSSWHCTLARDVVSLALIHLHTAGAGG